MLPFKVLTKIQAELLSFGKVKASVIEVSHRGVDFMELAQKLEQNLRCLMCISDDYKVLFYQGGASAQFSMVPINLLRGKTKANYVDSGYWSQKAIIEGRRYCEVKVSSSSFANKYTDIENFANWDIDSKAAYIHYTPNETIDGLEFDYIPEVDIPLVADMSSNILSREIDVSKFGVIYASAQKNIAPSGLTIVIVRKDLIGKVVAKQPWLFNYAVQADNNSMYNTPTTFSWYVALYVLEWIKDKGGLANIAKINHKKANTLYNTIDNSDFYINNVVKRYRSCMNVVFSLADSSLDELFLQKAAGQGLFALKGHRSVGGMRASIYNAMPQDGVDALVGFMHDFTKKHA